jgi:hypothetical protein
MNEKNRIFMCDKFAHKYPFFYPHFLHASYPADSAADFVTCFELTVALSKIGENAKNIQYRVLHNKI